MKLKNSISIGLLLAACLLQGTVQAQLMSKAVKGTFALTHATIHTITKGDIQDGTVIIQDGKIQAVGTGIATPAGAQVIDCTGKQIYPGMIDAGTHLGLSEVSSVSLTEDYNEIGDLIPEMQALTAVNPNSAAIPVTRVNGVTTVLTMPSGGRFPGTAALIDLNGYTPDQMYAGFKVVVLNWPSSGGFGRFDRRSPEDRKKAEEKALKDLNAYWDQAKEFAALDAAAKKSGQPRKTDYNPAMEALMPVVNGEASLLIEVNKDKDILSALRWIKEKKAKAILGGVSEGWRVADSIAAAGIPVLVGPVIDLPTRPSDRYDAPYANPGKLKAAGVKIAIRTMQTENVRNLPYHAGFAAAYGLGKEEALKAVTIYPAEIFGVADQLGSIEKGKRADLIVTDGDPFETKTNIEKVFIQGWEVPMDSRHIQLYNEFLDRQPGLKK